MSPPLLFRRGLVLAPEARGIFPGLSVDENLSLLLRSSAERDQAKAALREQWARPALARLRERARWVYETFRGPG